MRIFLLTFAHLWAILVTSETETEREMTKREKQIADMEAELHLPLTRARHRDLLAMLRHAKHLAKREAAIKSTSYPNGERNEIPSH